MQDKELDVQAIELQGVKKYIVEQIDSAEAELKKLKSGFLSTFLKSKEILGVQVYLDILHVLLNDVNQKIAKNVRI